MDDGRRPLLSEIWDQANPVGAKLPIFSRYYLVYSASAVAPIKKVQLTLTGSPLRAFQ